jgi:hypothetical protein
MSTRYRRVERDLYRDADCDRYAELVQSAPRGDRSHGHTRISQARSDGNNARVWGGMHYPSTVTISDAVGEAIAHYVHRNSMQRLRGQD